MANQAKEKDPYIRPAHKYARAGNILTYVDGGHDEKDTIHFPHEGGGTDIDIEKTGKQS